MPVVARTCEPERSPQRHWGLFEHIFCSLYRLNECSRPRYFYLSRSRACIPKRAAIEAALLRLAPAIPSHERMAVLDHAVDSRGLSVAAPETAAWLSLVAYVRHTFTDYDELLAEGYDHDSARHFVAARADEILQAWGVRRRLVP
jgi:hypothetical protein